MSKKTRNREKGKEKRRTPRWKTAMLIVLLLLLFGILLILACNVYICLSSRKQVFDPEDAGSCEKADCILVLGALVRANGSLSTALEERVETAVSLYKQGLAETVFLTGDGATEGYDEPEAMKQYCIEHGVPEEAIVCDPYGLSTIESMERAASVFGFKSVLIVTQDYHQYRSVWLAGKMGLSAQGVRCDMHHLPPLNYLREIAARVVAVFRIVFR